MGSQSKIREIQRWTYHDPYSLRAHSSLEEKDK